MASRGHTKLFDSLTHSSGGSCQLPPHGTVTNCDRRGSGGGYGRQGTQCPSSPSRSFLFYGTPSATPSSSHLRRAPLVPSFKFRKLFNKVFIRPRLHP